MSTPAHETLNLISADKVAGTPVYDGAGSKLGVIETLMIDKPSGRVAYAVLSFGGFLGLGRRHHPLPWSVLAYSDEYRGYRIDQPAATLEAAPAFDPDAGGDRLADPEFRRDIDEHYRPR